MTNEPKQAQYEWVKSNTPLERNNIVCHLWHMENENIIHREDMNMHDLELSVFGPKLLIPKDKEDLAREEGAEDLIGKPTNAELFIRGYAGYDAYPVSSAHFNDGKFLLATRVTEFFNRDLNVPSNGKYLRTLEHFKQDMETYFTVDGKEIAHDVRISTLELGVPIPQEQLSQIRKMGYEKLGKVTITFDTFKSFFTDSNLPEEYRDAVKELIE
ncbi:MAG: hypothetical protein ABIA78_02045 [archaeon]